MDFAEQEEWGERSSLGGNSTDGLGYLTDLAECFLEAERVADVEGPGVCKVERASVGDRGSVMSFMNCDAGRKDGWSNIRFDGNVILAGV